MKLRKRKSLKDTKFTEQEDKKMLNSYFNDENSDSAEFSSDDPEIDFKKFRAKQSKSKSPIKGNSKAKRAKNEPKKSDYFNSDDEIEQPYKAKHRKSSEKNVGIVLNNIEVKKAKKGSKSNKKSKKAKQVTTKKNNIKFLNY